jgi:raffinose/stachyose/melibiose transport system substrate-binding protein|uniref:ABC transporter substrate-binding protein n=1 Tax=Cephaloticoccus sp. TaxID=1985742 RepID=UPI00404B0F98
MAAKPKQRARFALILLALAYLTAVVLVLTRPGSALSNDKRVVIRFTHWQIEAGPREAFDAMIKRYEELNPNVRVEQVAVPGNVYNQWLRTQLIGGTASDIIEFGRHMQGMNDVPPRFFAPISEYVELPNPYNRGTALEGVRWRDTFKDGLNSPDAYIPNLSNYYAVTQCMLSMRLYYNPELLRELTGSEIPPSTYPEFLALNDKLKARIAGPKDRVALLAGSRFNSYVLLDPMLTRVGLDVSYANDRFRLQGPAGPEVGLEYLRGGWNFRRPELLDGLNRMREVSTTMRPGFQQLERDAAVQDFLRGRAMMIVTGTWDATSLTRMAPFKVGVTVVPWPTMADGKIGRYYWTPISEGATTAMSLYLNKASHHSAEAIDFLQFITSVEGNTIFVRESGWLPAVREVPIPDELKVHLPNFDGYTARSNFSHGFGSETFNLWEKQAYRLTSANGSVEDFLQAIEAQFPTAVRRDIETDMRNIVLSVRRDITPLIALAALDERVGLDQRERDSLALRESNQTMIEAKLYEAQLVLEKGPNVTKP